MEHADFATMVAQYVRPDFASLVNLVCDAKASRVDEKSIANADKKEIQESFISSEGPLVWQMDCPETLSTWIDLQAQKFKEIKSQQCEERTTSLIIDVTDVHEAIVRQLCVDGVLDAWIQGDNMACLRAALQTLTFPSSLTYSLVTAALTCGNMNVFDVLKETIDLGPVIPTEWVIQAIAQRSSLFFDWCVARADNYHLCCPVTLESMKIALAAYDFSERLVRFEDEEIWYSPCADRQPLYSPIRAAQSG